MKTSIFIIFIFISFPSGHFVFGNKVPKAEKEKVKHAFNAGENMQFLAAMPAFDLHVHKSLFVPDEWVKEVSVVPFSQFSNIHGKVYLTSVGALTYENVNAFDIKSIIDFAKEFNYEINVTDHIKYKDFTDTDDSNLEPLFDKVADEIKTFIENGKNVVVHCFAGCSRSATMVLAYLIKHKRYSLKDAFLLERKQRPIVRPNNGFFKQLISYEKRIIGKSSAKMVTLKRDGVEIEIPDFFETELPNLVDEEIKKAIEKKSIKTPQLMPMAASHAGGKRFVPLKEL